MFPFRERSEALLEKLCKFEGLTFRRVAHMDASDDERGSDHNVYKCVDFAASQTCTLSIFGIHIARECKTSTPRNAAPLSSVQLFGPSVSSFPT